MPVILAKSAGFCYGVERAVKLAEQTAREKGSCVMLGSIIHNAHVVRELEALGARQVDDVSQVRPGRGDVPLSSSASSTIRRCWAQPAGRRIPSLWTARRHWKRGWRRILRGARCP